MNKETKIGILGGGIEGVEAARYFSSHGYENVFLFDQREKIEMDLPEAVKFYGGPDYLEKAGECEVLFRSPGVNLNQLRITNYELRIKNSQLKITSTTQFFMGKCPCPVIGVTGTKGKGTTSTLIMLMLKEAGRDVFLGGNIGQSPLSFLDQLDENSYVVLELSSFQLQDLTISPSISVVLRVTSDHLDYHKNRDEYLEAKSSIVRYQKATDVVVLNADYDYSKYYAALTPAKKMWVSRESITNYELRITNDGEEAGGADTCSVRAGGIYFDKADGGVPELIGEVSKIALIGAHNLENVLPAVAVARFLGIQIPTIQKVLYSFAGLPHRLEFVREIGGVKYYNDSFSTTPETSVAATYAFEKPVILIAGGSEKGADYTEWGEALQRNPFLKKVFLIGEMAERMGEALKITNYELRITNDGEGSSFFRKTPLEVFRCQSLEEAVTRAHEEARAGDVVVMSPAAASFDMFRNYKERGERFREVVKKDLTNFFSLL